jgi:hypothetical protein
MQVHSLEKMSSNEVLFRRINQCFGSLHATLLVLALYTLAEEQKNHWHAYSRITVDGVSVEIYPLFISIAIHSFGFLTHLSFVINARRIIEDEFLVNNSNPYRWVASLAGDGAALVGVQLVIGGADLRALYSIPIIYFSVVSMCYLQDQSSTIKRPLLFGSVLYALLAISIVASQEGEEMTLNIYGTTIDVKQVVTFALIQFSLSFCVQFMHTKSRRAHIPVKTVTQHASPVASPSSSVSDDGPPLQTTIEAAGVELDNVLFVQRIGIHFECAYYLNSTFFQMLVSWVIIGITREGLELSSVP